MVYFVVYVIGCELYIFIIYMYAEVYTLKKLNKMK